MPRVQGRRGIRCSSNLSLQWTAGSPLLPRLAGSHPPLLGDTQPVFLACHLFPPGMQPGVQPVLPSHGGSRPSWPAHLRDPPPRHRLPHSQAGAGAPQPEPRGERVSRPRPGPRVGGDWPGSGQQTPFVFSLGSPGRPLQPRPPLGIVPFGCLCPCPSRDLVHLFSPAGKFHRGRRRT